jgi:hypothetical protein
LAVTTHDESRACYDGMASDVARKHRYEFPDALRPQWSAVCLLLAASGEQRTRCEFQTMLDCIRRGWKKAGAVKAANEYTDEQVWLSHLDWLAFEITYHSVRGHTRRDDEPCTNCASLAAKYPDHFQACGRMRIECMAWRAKSCELDRWLEYFKQEEREPPAWLGRQS